MKKPSVIFLALCLCCSTPSCSRPEQAIPEDRLETSGPDTHSHRQRVHGDRQQMQAALDPKPANGATLIPRPAPTPFKVRRCINMGNALEAPNEGDWGYKIRAQDFATLKTAGFDTVRLPIRWDAHTAHSAPYKINPNFMNRVTQVVRQAQNHGLNVIIDVHHYEALMQNPAREQARFLAIWEQIAHSFADAPDTVYFEALNEPTIEISSQQLNALYARLVPLIRKTNPNRKIILGGNSWNSIEALAQVKPPKDTNIVLTFHDYSPQDFTHQGAEWEDNPPPLGRHYGSKADILDKNSIYAQARAIKTRTGLDILVGEFGVIDKVPLHERTDWIADRRKTIEANKLSWCYWDFAGAFKAYDIEQEQFLPRMLDALTGR